MNFWYIVSIPAGFKIKYIRSNKGSMKIFVFFKNRIYSINLTGSFFAVCGSHTILFCSTHRTFANYIQFFLVELLMRGFLKNWKLGLKLVGVGYRFIQIKKNSIVLKLGYSHLIKFYFNTDITFVKSVKRPTKLIFFCPDKEKLAKFITIVKLLRVPDNYKGKGIQLFKDVILIKKREKFGVY